MRAYHEEYRYRVVDIAFVEGKYVTAYRIYEFKTSKAARACETRLLREGKHVLYQTARVTWMTPEEYEAEVATLPKAAE